MIYFDAATPTKSQQRDDDNSNETHLNMEEEPNRSTHNWSNRQNEPQPTATPTGNDNDTVAVAADAAAAGDAPGRMVGGGKDDNRAPTNPVELFAWICAQNFPQIEDELPPPGFDEVGAMDDTDTDSDSDSDFDIDFFCMRCDRLLLRLDAHLGQRSIGTQTVMAAVAAAAAAARQLRAELLTQQTRCQLVEQQTQTEEPYPMPTESPLLAAVRQSFSVQMRRRSVWAMVKALLVLVSLLHSCYWMGDSIQSMLRDLMDRAQFIYTPAPPPPPRSLPVFIWGQLCRLAHKLHIV